MRAVSFIPRTKVHPHASTIYRIPPARVVQDLVAAGHTGRKAGAGFYLWPKPRRLPAPLRKVMPRLHKKPNPAVQGGTPRKRFADAEIQDRLVLLFVNEAVRCLDEGVLRSPTDGDLAAILGLGFPPFRGGPFHHADSIGAQALASRLGALAATHGSRYEPARSIADCRKFFEE